MLTWLRIKYCFVWFLALVPVTAIFCRMLDLHDLMGAIQFVLFFLGCAIGLPVVMGTPRTALMCSLWQDSLIINFPFGSRTINIADVVAYYYTPPSTWISKCGVSVVDGTIDIRIKGENGLVRIVASRVEPALYRQLKHLPRFDPKGNLLWYKTWFARIYIALLLLLLANLIVFHRLIEPKHPPV